VSRINSTQPLESAAIDTRRRQLIAEEAATLMMRKYPQLAQDPNAILIGLTHADKYIRNETWQFAFSYRTEGRFPVVSSAHMNPVNLGAAFNDDLLDSRIRKMVMKNIGLLYYLFPVNDNPKSLLMETFRGWKISIEWGTISNFSLGEEKITSGH
jgi:predicted Zn-dependent protease